MTFQKLLAEIRAQRGRGDITQADLADAAGISPATFNRRVGAGGGDFTLNELLRITTALDVPLHLSIDEVEVVDSTEVFRPDAAGRVARRLVKT